MFYKIENNKIYLTIKVIPNSQSTSVREIQENEIIIELKARPENNLANIELIKFISREMGVKKDKITIIAGLKNKNKLIVIDDDDENILNNLMQK